MTRWRVTATMHGKRVATSIYWGSEHEAQRYANDTNRNYPGANAKAVRDSAEVRAMIP